MDGFEKCLTVNPPGPTRAGTKAILQLDLESYSPEGALYAHNRDSMVFPNVVNSYGSASVPVADLFSADYASVVISMTEYKAVSREDHPCSDEERYAVFTCAPEALDYHTSGIL